MINYIHAVSFATNILSDSPGLCTGGRSHRVGWGCTCPPSPVTSSWSWSPVQCSPCEDPRRSVCLRCCRLGCWRWSSPCRRAQVETAPGWHEARCAALLTICESKRKKLHLGFPPKRSQPGGRSFKGGLTCLKPAASWKWWSRSECWSHCRPSLCPGSSRSSELQRCGQACCCLFRIIRSHVSLPQFQQCLYVLLLLLTFNTDWHNKKRGLLPFIVSIEGKFFHMHHALP